jgi:sugar phosphate permease
MVRYAVYLWLPMFLRERLHLSTWTSGALSTAFEIGSAVGSWLISFFLHSFDSPLLYCSVLCSCCTSSVLLFSVASTSGLFNSFFTLVFVTISIALIGAFCCGVDMMIGGPVGCQLAGPGANKAAVIGAINGLGFSGVIAEGPLVQLMISYFGWPGYFFFLLFFAAGSTLALLFAHFEFLANRAKKK